MKKIYLIATIALLTFSNCKKKDAVESETTNDTVVMDSTSMEKPVIDAKTKDSAATNGSNVDLLDTLSTKSKKIVTNPANGKFALAETRWKLTELNGRAVKNTSGKDYYLELDSKSGKFSSFVGCNKISGMYVNKSTDKLMFMKMIATKMACANMNLESEFMKSLANVDNYMLDGKNLHFHKGKNMAIAKFVASK